MGSPRRAPLSQSSLYSNWSVNSSWSQSSRLGAREEFWVSTPKRRSSAGAGRPPSGPPGQRPRPSSAANGRPPRLPQLGRSRSQSRDDHVVSRGSARVEPRELRPPREPRRPTSSAAGRAAREERKEWTTPPLRELVPAEVRSKVLQMASKGSALIIEMLWSSSPYLPAHRGGQKYKEIASSLKELMEGRISRGSPLPVLTIEQPVPIKKKGAGIYDRYSEWERSFGLVASNSSYTYAPPSRMGAFEVHLVQGSWDPELCACGPLEKDQGRHCGPPVSGSLGILCSACALRHSEGGSVAHRGMNPEQTKEYEKQMQQQHSLLHSKLWTRRWPGLRFLVGRVGAILIRRVPDVARAVTLRRVDFRKPCSQSLQRFDASVGRKAVVMPPDPVQAIRQGLADLDCPAAKGWFISKEGPEILCRCGGGSHVLELQQVLSILEQMGFDAAAFQSFCSSHREEWTGCGVNDFIGHFLKLEMQQVLDQKREEHAQETARRKAQEELAYQQLCRGQYHIEQDDICKEYQKAFDESHPDAEKIYVSLCLFLCRKLPSHGLDLRRLEHGEATVEEAAEAVTKAVELNEERREKWSKWYQEVESWKRNDSEEEEAIFEDILSQRPDVADMVSYKENESFMEERLEQDIQSFEAKMQQAYPSWEFYQGRINALKETFLRQLADYHQTVDGIPS